MRELLTYSHTHALTYSLSFDVPRPVLFEWNHPACGSPQDQPRRRVRTALDFFTLSHSQLFAKVRGLLGSDAPNRQHFAGVCARETSILLHHASALMQLKGRLNHWLATVHALCHPPHINSIVMHFR